MFNLDESNFSNVTSFLSEFRYIFSDSIVLDLNPAHLTFNNGLLASASDNFNVFSFLSLDEMIELSTLKNDVDELVKIFPALGDDIELLDL
jgi:hypothetical protein